MKILLIQMLRLGDALQVIPIIRGLKAHFPGCSISVLASEVGEQVFRREPHLDAVHVLDKHRISELMCRSGKRDILSALGLLHSALEPLLTTKWDWVINFSFSFPSALIACLLEARRRSGFVASEKRQYLSREKWFAHSLASFTHRRYSSFNWVDINKKILGLPSVPRHPLLKPDKEALRMASSRLRSLGFEGKKIVGMQPGASGTYKMWPIENFCRLGRALIDRHDCRVLVFGGKGEQGLGRILKTSLGENAEDLTGKTTLDDLGAFLSLCSVLVTNDTGPMHLAYSIGTRVIGLFFNSHFVETGPYGKGHVAVHPDMPCFPCPGPAGCPHKDCLNRISPEGIEKLVMGGASRSSTPTGNGDLRAYVSDFDPWDILEWVPLIKARLRFQDMERIILRTSWLTHRGVITEHRTRQSGHLAHCLEMYAPPEDKAELAARVWGLMERLSGFESLLQKAVEYAAEIQEELSRSHPDTARINQLGSRLTRAENEALSFEKGSIVSFIGELMTVYLQEIEISNLLELSRKTLAVYHEIMAFTGVVRDNAESVGGFLSGLQQGEKGTS